MQGEELYARRQYRELTMGEAAEMLGGHRTHVSSVARSLWRRRQVAPKGLPSRVLSLILTPLRDAAS